MIASVQGRVAQVTADSAVIEVGGVGLRVHCTPASLTLYGFPDDDARQLFELLQTASGVGPRLAQAVLAVHSPQTVRKAIADGDVAVLTQVPGIGRKSADRLVLELRDRIGPVSPATPAAGPGSDDGWQEQVRTGLIGLGWSAAQADRAVTEVAQSLDGEVPPVPQLLRQAIRLLGEVR